MWTIMCKTGTYNVTLCKLWDFACVFVLFVFVSTDFVLKKLKKKQYQEYH